MIIKKQKNIKHMILGVAFVTAFLFFVHGFASGGHYEENDVEATSQSIIEEKKETAYKITIDSKEVCIIGNKQIAEEMVETLVTKAKNYYSADLKYSLLNEIEITEGEYLSASVNTDEECKKALGIDVLMGEPKVSFANGETLMLSLAGSTITEEYIETEHETVYSYVYGVGKTYEKVLAEGENGVIKRVYETISVDGEVSEETLIYEKILSEPVVQVVEVGVTPSMQLASAELAFFTLPYEGKVSCTYGYRYLGGYEFHKGIDLVAKNGSCYGDIATAAADGVVVESGYSGGMGNYVVIDHEYGFSTVYMHFSKRLVSVGDTVKAGDPIGKIGSTGRVTGPHLHFEIQLHGESVNPENYLKFE